MKVLVVEHELSVLKTLTRNLTENGFKVDFETNAKTAYLKIKLKPYDLIILGQHLDDKLGTDFCLEIRQLGIKTPLIILEESCSPVTISAAITAGADDCISKHASFEELNAKITAILRRPKDNYLNSYRYADLELDPKRYFVKRGNHRIVVTKKEFALLEHLIRNATYVVRKTSLLEEIWGNIYTSTNTIQAHILSLRRKLSKGNKRNIIQTVNGLGYKLDLDP